MLSLNSFKKICVAGVASSLVLIALSAPSVNAVVLDSNAYSRYTAARSNLLTVENDLQRDYDSLQRQVDLLNRQNKDRRLTPQINDLSRALDQTYSELCKVRQNIRSLDLMVL
jgi:peptidoglycan hydrolase CwlO-like protein